MLLENFLRACNESKLEEKVAAIKDKQARRPRAAARSANMGADFRHAQIFGDFQLQIFHGLERTYFHTEYRTILGSPISASWFPEF